MFKCYNDLMKILGLDPGVGRTGWGIIRQDKGKIESIGYGCIETEAKKEIGQRLLETYNEVEKIFRENRPDAVAIEELFFNTNAKTAFMVGQARGVLMLLAAQNGLSLGVYTPLQVKIAITGYGQAEKSQVGKMVKTLLGLSEIPRPDDVTDALAIAITHVFSKKFDPSLPRLSMASAR